MKHTSSHWSALVVLLLALLMLIAPGRAQTGSAPPAPWSTVDIGPTAVGSVAVFSNSVFTIQAAGSDIWGTADAFSYTAQPVAAQVEIVARVTALQNTQPFAKAGVMLRQTLDAASPNVLLDVTPDGSVEMAARTVKGDVTAYLGGTSMRFPTWLRLSRSGSSVWASVSSDGAAWTAINTVAIDFGPASYAGLAVTSHLDGQLTTASFDNVTVSALAPVGDPATPVVPSAPSPSDKAIGVLPNPTLMWIAPGATTYDIAFGATNPPPLVATGLLVPAYTPSVNTDGGTVYWQVIAHNGNGTAPGPVWTFTSRSLSASMVGVWLTTTDRSNLLSQQSGLVWGPDDGGAVQTVDVDETTRYQQMDGVGVAVTDTSAWLLTNVLSPDARAQLMTQLFDRSTGIGLSYLRVPIGATDFVLSPYTYDDMPAGQTDYALSAFSTARDRSYIQPVILQARSINPSIRIIATPWSPPAWMKNPPALQAGTIKSDPATLSALANYFVRFIQDYGAAGIPIDRITPQNEPLLQDGTYPSTLIDAATESTFIGSYLGPALQAAGLSTRIVAYDHNWDNTAYPASVLASAAGTFVSGTAWHCYGGFPDAMSVVHDQFPSRDVLLTECSANMDAAGFTRNLRYDMQTLVVAAARNWARTIVKWNIALDTDNGPHVGGCTGCLGLFTVDRTVSPPAIEYNYDFYTLGHISKFVQPGAYRIASNTFGTDNIEDVAFENPDGTIVIVVVNTDTSVHTFKIRQGGNSARYTLPGGAAVTFTLPGPATTIPNPVPAPWSDQDVGAVAVPGSATSDGSVITITASGSDIWGTADAFNFVAQPAAGDVDLVARVRDLTNTNALAKAGVMLRSSAAQGSAHVLLDVKPDGNVEFMQRAVDDGPTAYLRGALVGFPAWLRLSRRGVTVTGSVSIDGVTWTIVGSTVMSAPTTLLAGLAVSSHTLSLATSSFDSVSVSQPGGTVTAPAGPSPATGATDVPAAVRLTWSATGAATYALAFGTTAQPPVIATGLQSAAFTALGLAPGSTYYWQVTAQGGASVVSGPVWSLTTALASGLPPGSIDIDIGSVPSAGVTAATPGTLTVTAAGSDIWGGADSFHYVAAPVVGDLQIVTRVTHLDNTSPFAKAGLMLRDSQAPDSAQVILDVKPDGEIEFMQRASAGADTNFLQGAIAGFPAWLRLARVGALVTASVSGDGVTWTPVGIATVSSTAGLAGYAVTSHAATPATAVFQVP
jgi:glucosylceramidase